MSSTINPISASSAASDPVAQSSSTSLAGAAPSKELFLQLLVAQIKNQDPLNPTDSMQFVSQLAQFSELEQVIAIRSDMEQSAAQASSGAAAPATPQA